MRRLLAVLLPVLMLAACGSSKLHNDVSNTQVQKAATAGEQIVGNCVQRFHHLKQIKACIVPPGSGPKLEACLAQDVARDKGLTKAQRQRLYADWAVCAEKYR